MSEFTYYPETTTNLPEGIKGGLLPRRDRPGESCPMLSAAAGFDVIPRSEWATWIGRSANLSSAVWSIFNQESVGSCASESVCGGFKICRELAGLPKVEFNPLGIYGRVNGGSDNGSTLSDNLTFLRDKGAFPESIWPRSKGWRANPSQEAYDAAKNYRLDEFFEVSNWDEFATALLRGWPVYYGRQSHAIVAVDLLNDRQVVYLNSWGQWGQGTEFCDIPYGFGIDNYSVLDFRYGCYCMRSTIVEVEP